MDINQPKHDKTQPDNTNQQLSTAAITALEQPTTTLQASSATSTTSTAAIPSADIKDSDNPYETSGGFYDPATNPAYTAPAPQAAIEWTAAEFIHHEKSAGWYSLLAASTVVLVALAYWLTNGDKIAAVVILFVAIMFGVLAARKPRELTYYIDTNGITIGSRTYHFNEFKSFSIFDEGGVSTISLLPLKRIMPAIGLHYPEQEESEIVNMLSLYLPLDQRTPDSLDRLMRKIHF